MGPYTDIYAAGLVLYEMIAGRGPFDEEKELHLIGKAHLSRAAPPLSSFAKTPIPGPLEALVASALAKDPRMRPRDAFTFAKKASRARADTKRAVDGRHERDEPPDCGECARGGGLQHGGAGDIARRTNSGHEPGSNAGDECHRNGDGYDAGHGSWGYAGKCTAVRGGRRSRATRSADSSIARARGTAGAAGEARRGPARRDTELRVRGGVRRAATRNRGHHATDRRDHERGSLRNDPARARARAQALGAAGGLGPDADRNVKLQRGKIRRKIDLAAIYDGRAHDIALEHGDSVFVAERVFDEDDGAWRDDVIVVPAPTAIVLTDDCKRSIEAHEPSDALFAFSTDTPMSTAITAQLGRIEAEKIRLESQGYGPHHPFVEALERRARATIAWMKSQAWIDVQFRELGSRAWLEDESVRRNLLVPDSAPPALRRLAWELGVARVELDSLPRHFDDGHPQRVAARARVGNLELRFKRSSPRSLARTHDSTHSMVLGSQVGGPHAGCNETEGLYPNVDLTQPIVGMNHREACHHLHIRERHADAIATLVEEPAPTAQHCALRIGVRRTMKTSKPRAPGSIAGTLSVPIAVDWNETPNLDRLPPQVDCAKANGRARQRFHFQPQRRLRTRFRAITQNGKRVAREIRNGRLKSR